MTRDGNGADSDKILNAAIMSCVEANWKKTGLIVERVMRLLGKKWDDEFVEIMLIQIRNLENTGKIEINGDISHLRNSEIRIVSVEKK